MKLLCDAVAFCYGPATVLKQILRSWRPQFRSVTLAATGTTLEYMQRYRNSLPLIDHVIHVDTEDPAALEAREGRWDVLLSVCNPVGFAALRDRARFSVFWDFLLWMRTEGGAPEFQAEAYVVEMFPGCDLALQRWGTEIRNPVPCPVVANWSETVPKANAGAVLINFGGQRSKLTRPGENTDYADQMIELLQAAARQIDHRGPFVVASDALTARHLERRFASEGWTFASLAHEDFLAQIRISERLFTHPGLYSPFEGFGLHRPVYFLPSSNYTQVLQLRDFRRLGLAPRSIDWVDLVGHQIPAGLPEAEGVRRVLNLVAKVYEPSVRERLVATFAAWLMEDREMTREMVATQRRCASPYFGDYSAVLDGVARAALSQAERA